MWQRERTTARRASHSWKLLEGSQIWISWRNGTNGRAVSYFRRRALEQGGRRGLYVAPRSTPKCWTTGQWPRPAIVGLDRPSFFFCFESAHHPPTHSADYD